jgi:hypothetical protein
MKYVLIVHFYTLVSVFDTIQKDFLTKAINH